VRFPYRQLEFVAETYSFACVSPIITLSSEEDVFCILPHPKEPYTGAVPDKAEGIMITLGSEEVRVKRENTVEVDVPPHGTIEVVERDGQLIPIKLRPLKTVTAHPMGKLLRSINIDALRKQKPMPMVLVQGDEDSVRIENGVIVQSSEWMEKYGTIVRNKFYHWEIVNGKQIPYESEDFYQIDNSVARVKKSRPVTKMPEFHSNGRQIALLVTTPSGKVLLEKDMNGLRQMPILLTRSQEVVSINCLIDRVYGKWESVRVTGPYEVGLVDYYHHEQMKESVLDSYDVDPDQVTFVTTLCYVDFNKVKVKKPNMRLVHDVSQVHTFSRVTIKTGECAYYLAEAFNLKVAHRMEATLIGHNGDSFEKIVMMDQSYVKPARVKKKNKRNGNRKNHVLEGVRSQYKAHVVQWDSVNNSMSGWDVFNDSMEELMKKIVDYGDVIVFPSNQLKECYCGYLSTLSYFLRGRENG